MGLIQGLRKYFVKHLPSVLLYQVEQAQFKARPSKTEDSLCADYSASHLLRLFVLLPGLIAEETELDFAEQALIKSRLVEVVL